MSKDTQKLVDTAYAICEDKETPIEYIVGHAYVLDQEIKLIEPALKKCKERISTFALPTKEKLIKGDAGKACISYPEKKIIDPDKLFNLMLKEEMISITPITNKETGEVTYRIKAKAFFDLVSVKVTDTTALLGTASLAKITTKTEDAPRISLKDL